MSASPELQTQYPPRDRVGKIVPHRLSAFTWMKIVPEIFRAFDKRVPDEFWNKDVTEDERDAAVIACPCGGEPIAPFGNFAVCDEPECGRVYLNLGKTVRVAKFDPAELNADPWDEDRTPVAD